MFNRTKLSKERKEAIANAKAKAKELLETAKDYSMLQTDKKVVRQMIKYAKKEGKEIIRIAKARSKAADSIKEIEDVINDVEHISSSVVVDKIEKDAVEFIKNRPSLPSRILSTMSRVFLRIVSVPFIIIGMVLGLVGILLFTVISIILAPITIPMGISSLNKMAIRI